VSYRNTRGIPQDIQETEAIKQQIISKEKQINKELMHGRYVNSSHEINSSHASKAAT
jgi:hypothetical protein